MGATVDQSCRTYTLMGLLEMAPSELSEVEQVSRRIAETQTWLRGAKAVESFDLAATLQREITELEERRRKLLDQKASGVVEEQRPDASEAVTDESLRPTALNFSRGTEPNKRIGIMWERLTPGRCRGSQARAGAAAD